MNSKFPSSQVLESIDWKKIQTLITNYLTSRIPENGLPAVGGNHEMTLWTNSTAAEIGKLVANEVGDWFGGLDYCHPEGGRCGCHSLFGHDIPISKDLIPNATSSAINACKATTNYFLKIRQFFDSSILSLGNADFSERLEHDIEALINLTADLSSCDSNWYELAKENIIEFLKDKGLIQELSAMQKAESYIDGLISGRFESWVSPDKSVVHSAANEIQIELVKNLYAEKYQ